MKISIITPTYNRAGLLENLYKSIVANSKYNSYLEWIIIDDGSTDNTKEIIRTFGDELDIRYYYQENKGKMAALNYGIKECLGDLIIEIDSDDVLTEDAVDLIKIAYEESKKEKDIYALCFLKYDKNGNNMGQDFKVNKTTMFDLYFKQGETGEKALVFFADKRKEYTYILEKDEKFSTEARMYHKMDLKYKIKCYNEPIMICEYRNDGYSQNITKVFKENPYGYYNYFKEMFDQDMSGILFKKRLYIIKHYILFSYLTKQKNVIKNVKGFTNKLLTTILYIPGKIKTKTMFGEIEESKQGENIK